MVREDFAGGALAKLLGSQSAPQSTVNSNSVAQAIAQAQQAAKIPTGRTVTTQPVTNKVQTAAATTTKLPGLPTSAQNSPRDTFTQPTAPVNPKAGSKATSAATTASSGSATTTSTGTGATTSTSYAVPEGSSGARGQQYFQQALDSRNNVSQTIVSELDRIPNYKISDEEKIRLAHREAKRLGWSPEDLDAYYGLPLGTSGARFASAGYDPLKGDGKILTRYDDPTLYAEADSFKVSNYKDGDIINNPDGSFTVYKADSFGNVGGQTYNPDGTARDPGGPRMTINQAQEVQREPWLASRTGPSHAANGSAGLGGDLSGYTGSKNWLEMNQYLNGAGYGLNQHFSGYIPANGGASRGNGRDVPLTHGVPGSGGGSGGGTGTGGGGGQPGGGGGSIGGGGGQGQGGSWGSGPGPQTVPNKAGWWGNYQMGSPQFNPNLTEAAPGGMFGSNAYNQAVRRASGQLDGINYAGGSPTFNEETGTYMKRGGLAQMRRRKC